MADKIGGIYVDLGLNSAAFSKGLTNAQGQVQKFSAVTKSSLGRLGSNAFDGLTQGAVGVLAPLLTAGAAIEGAKRALADFGDIADKSAAAGIDAEFFQSLAHQASLSGVAIDELAGALAGFAKNAGLAAEGKGRMVSQLQALDPLLLANIQKATTQEQRIRAVADAMARTTNEAQRAAIASAAFGDLGPKLANVFAGGAKQIDEMMRKAKELGLIVDRNLIARADELGDKFDTANQIVDLKLKQALVNLAPYLVNLVGITGDWLTSLGIVLDQLQNIENRQFLNPLQNQLAGVYNQMQPVKDRIAEIEAQLAAGGPNGMILRLDLQDSQKQLAALTDQANKLLSRIQELQGYKPPTAPTPASPQVDDVGMGASFSDLSDFGFGTRERAAQAAIDQAEAVEALIDNLRLEHAMVGLSATDQAVLTAQRQAGTAATAEQIAEIEEIIRATEAERTAIEGSAEAMQQFGDIARSATQGFVHDLLAGKSAAEAFGNVLQDIAGRLLDMGLTAPVGRMFTLEFAA